MPHQTSQQIHQALLMQCQSFPFLCSVLERNGPRTLERQPTSSFLPYLSRAVAGQQLSVNAAKTIWRRVELLSVEKGSLQQTFVDEHYQALRDCGLSNAKVKTILGINQALMEGALDSAFLASNDPQTIVKQLTGLWGIGPWTAEMALMFFFGMPDVWSAGDAALMRGLSSLAEKEGVDAEAILSAATPYRTYLALHIWEMLDAELLSE
ncbi:DNA-3-methyladenine glycosylase 2 family protein [Vibrio vulnificus]|uniref:DNA-3-methyladenine glycosylase family protein n=1 Tax=Vibrio vulnificus TaxID=672 RepID=UPI0019D46A7A|nr:DNA-3-methyladenine glycosylase 2 family protein [Vibrio vulnificus]EGR0107963.1 DNA-3-methyladenine glycosylase 2 family protein [Vibrio vulnificus]EIF5017668.1 DNA-3-methyladenine glycosylase 2 family protein [Vibrio vulnificus]EIO2322673.1 DNA-3-methyladenine glycosylase 2 family protein [Vibrio vulnificus]EIO4068114.1 DNA-3-methyladenine glycosylase 2 family protein [Vibrio vulnificus]EJO9869983.1 DNA-3-methyladenine glycosylase 2 family protein [Vibrio vulnificus]